MRRLALATVVILSAAWLPAASHYGVGADAFSRAVPSLQAETRVFAPFSFEVDCVVFAEAVDTLSRAAVAEALGMLSGFAPEYPPILKRLETCTNGFSFVEARGFCVPEIDEPNPVFRRQLQRDYGVVTCRDFPVEGANSWFRASMDGQMEDFSVAVDGHGERRFGYYDLVSIRVAWQEPFPLNNSRKLPFACADGTRPKLDFMADVRVADTLETSEFQLLRLPLRGGFQFYALSPRGKASLDDIRKEASATEVGTLLASLRSVINPGVARGPTVVVLPRLELDTTTDVTETMHLFKCPTQGLTGIAANCPAREVVQRVRFRLLEHAEDEKPLTEKPVDSQVRMESCARKAVLNRPFLFLVVDETTETIPVMGQFTGRMPDAGTSEDKRIQPKAGAEKGELKDA